jgi:hypothetical protein
MILWPGGIAQVVEHLVSMRPWIRSPVLKRNATSSQLGYYFKKKKFFFFLEVLVFEPRASHLLGSHFTTGYCLNGDG